MHWRPSGTGTAAAGRAGDDARAGLAGPGRIVVLGPAVWSGVRDPAARLLFTPAVALVVAMSASGEPAGRHRAEFASLLAWAVAAGVGVAAGFAPLAARGCLAIVRGVRQASHGRYGEYPVGLVGGDRPARRAAVRDGIRPRGRGCPCGPVRDSPPGAALGTDVVAGPGVSATSCLSARVPRAPTMADLVDQPGRDHRGGHDGVETAILAGAGSVGLLLARRVARRPAVLRHCSQRASDWRPRAQDSPAHVPLGAAAHFAPGDSNSPYTWDQYRAVLAYLRLRTDSRTQVANLLRNVPFPGVNGSVGRISPLGADAGILWLYQFDIGREADYARLLEAADDAVVVWIPGERSFDPRLQIPILEHTVPQFYRPEARLGGIQVWRRLPHPR